MDGFCVVGESVDGDWVGELVGEQDGVWDVGLCVLGEFVDGD